MQFSKVKVKIHIKMWVCVYTTVVIGNGNKNTPGWRHTMVNHLQNVTLFDKK